MLYRLTADLVVLVHLVFIVFVPVGALLAWRRPSLVRLHAPSVVWAVATVAVGLPCPLTSLEKLLHRSAGEAAYGGGFVDHYLEGVLYPEALTPLLQAMGAVAIAVGYARLHHSRRRTASRLSGAC